MSFSTSPWSDEARLRTELEDNKTCIKLHVSEVYIHIYMHYVVL